MLHLVLMAIAGLCPGVADIHPALVAIRPGIAGSAMSISGSTVTWDFTVNPDGTGKVAVENLLPPMPPEAVSEKGAEDILRLQFLREMLFVTGGVEVWANVSMEKQDTGLPAEASAKAGRMMFKGTAYFKDVTKVGFGPSREGKLTWTKDLPAGQAGAKGDMVLTATAFAVDEPPASTEKAPALSDEEIAKRVADLKQKFKDRRESMAASLGRMKLDLIYRLPGTVTDVTGFTKAADGSLHWTVVGTKLFEAYEKAMGDDAFLKKCVVDGKAPITEVMAKEIPSALRVAVATEMKPQFDYAAEVKTAKDNRREMFDKLHLLGPPAKGDTAATATATKQP